MYSRLLTENDLNRFIEFANFYAEANKEKSREVEEFVEMIQTKTLHWVEIEDSPMGGNK